MAAAIDRAAIQKTGFHVVTTSIRWVDPHATIKSAKPTRKYAQSRGIARLVLRAM